MKKTIWIILFIFLFTLINTLFFPAKIYRKDVYNPVSYFNINRVSDTQNIEGYFNNRNECGYFNFRNGLVHRYKGSEDEYVVANKFFYVTYKKVGDTLSLYSPLGVKIKDIQSFAYPYVPNDNPVFYAVKTNGSGFFSYNIQGDLLNAVDYTSIISSISTDKYANTLVSLLDGETFLYSPKSEVLFTTDSGDNDSKIVIAKSNAIDLEGSYIAVCSGIEPEYVEIYQKKTNGTVKKIKTDTNFRYSSILKFDSDRLYYEGENSLKYYDLKKGRLGTMELRGEIIDLQFDQLGNAITLTNEDNLYCINVFSPNGKKKFYKEFVDTIDNIKVLQDNSFYFRLNDIIVKFSCERS